MRGTDFMIALFVSLGAHSAVLLGGGLWLSYAAHTTLGQVYDVELVIGPFGLAKGQEDLAAPPLANAQEPVKQEKKKTAARLTRLTSAAVAKANTLGGKGEAGISEAAREGAELSGQQQQNPAEGQGMQSSSLGGAGLAVEYPEESRRKGEEGRVVYRVAISASGQAEDLALISSSGFSRLDQAAEKALRQAKFLPANRLGFPVPSSKDIALKFKLDG
jgi:protein TonB